MIGVYKITSPSNRVYIGSSKNINVRFAQYHRYHCVGQRKLFNSFKKYGVENHKFEIVCECDLSDIFLKEEYYIDFYDSVKKGLNCQKPIGENRIEFSDETKLLISKNMKEYWSVISEEDKLIRLNKFVGSTKGKKLSFEHKEKIKKTNIFPLCGSSNYMYGRSDLIHNSKKVLDTLNNKEYDSLSQCAKELSTYPKKIKRLIDKGDKRFILL